MQSHQKHRKVFYVPGMFSLVVLPIMFLCYFYSHKSFYIESSIPLGLPDKQTIEKLSNETGFPIPRKYKEFTFNGSLKFEKTKLENFQSALKVQNKLKDTINGIKLHIGSKMKYEVYIEILEILEVEKTPTYIPYKNDFWILNANPKKEKAADKEHFQMRCGTQHFLYLSELEAEQIIKEKKREKELNKFYKENILPYFLYFSIVILNIFSLLKFNRNRIYNQKSYL
jgi:ribosomal protein S10